MRTVLFVLLLAGLSFAGNFQAKNDTSRTTRYYISKEDSVRKSMRRPEKKARESLNLACAWTVDCREADRFEPKEPRHTHRPGPYWRKP